MGEDDGFRGAEESEEPEELSDPVLRPGSDLLAACDGPRLYQLHLDPQVTEEEREQLQRVALEIFLSGGDAAFVDYSAIDNDPSLDDQRQINQEAEEAYFDY